MSRKPLTDGYWWLGSLLAGGLVFAVLFWPIVQAPGAWLFNPARDGLKNYFTLAWYVGHDSGLRLSGMNYPWGEQVVFTDDQPLLAWLAQRTLGPHVPLPRLYGLLHGWLLLAQVLSVPPLVALLRRCRLPGAYSTVMAVMISLLAPQLARLLGHYALAVSAAIPWLWYLLVRAGVARKPEGWWLAYAVVALALGTIHPYYLPLAALLLAAHLLVWLGQRRRPDARFWVGAGLALVLPVGLFQLGLGLTDPFAADRPTEPFGFFQYSASVWSVFLPTQPSLNAWWHEHLFRPTNDEWEGYAYVGVVATLVALATLLRVGRYAVRRDWPRLWHPHVPPLLRAGLWAGLLILLFAMGWPLRWGLEGLLEIAGPLRQFRSIGRFAWIFYYLFTVYAAWVLYVVWRAARRGGWRVAANGLFSLALLIWAAEAGVAVADTLAAIEHPPVGAGRQLTADPAAPGDFRHRLRAGGHEPEAFQAIVPLPQFVIGSEKIYVETPDDEIVYQAMRAALETGRPLAAAMLSRTPLWQAQGLAQLLAPAPIDKLLWPCLHADGRPLLLLASPRVTRDAAQEALLAKAVIFYRDAEVWLAALPIDSMVSDNAARRRQFAQTATTRVPHPATGTGSAYWTTGNGDGVLLHDLDDADDPAAAPELATVAPLQGRGAHAVRRGELTLFDGPLPRAGAYEVSAWAYLRVRGLPVLRALLRTPDGRVVFRDSTEAKFSTTILGDWTRSTLRLPANQPGLHLRVWLEGRRFVADAAQLRPLDTDVWARDSATHQLFFNNFPLPPSAPRPLRWPAGESAPSR